MSQPIPELTSVTDGIARALAAQPEAWARLHAMPLWVVYTDGSAPIKNPGGAIGFASVFVLQDGGAFEVSGGVPGRTTEPATSNNRAEIAGVIAILELIYRTHLEKLPLPREVDVVCDSQYVVNCAQGKWKKHKNRDLWQRFDQVASIARAQKVKIAYRWTRAHVGTEWNERADVLAKEAALGPAGEAALPRPDAGTVETGGGASSGRGGSGPNGTSSDGDSQHHYLLRLFAAMTGRTRSEGYYELRTPSRARQQTLEVHDTVTLDEAEYHTLNAALADLLRTLQSAGRSPSDFRICVESSRDLMLKQMQGVYGVKSERLIPLHGRTRQLVRQFAAVDWVNGDKSSLKTLSEA
jgi:ribonuclease HI